MRSPKLAAAPLLAAPLLAPPLLAPVTLAALAVAACFNSEGTMTGSASGASGLTTATATAATEASASESDGASSTSGASSASASASSTATTGASESDSITGDATSDPTTTTTTTTTTGPVTATDSTSDATTTTTGDDPCKPNVDIVFSMDVSTSMLVLLQKLEDEILTVDAAVQALPGSPDVRYGLVVFVDDTKIINNGGPYADVQTLKQDFNTWWNFTQSNSQVNGGGSNSDWPENSIDSIHSAAVDYQWRPTETTLRMVIHCTDDTFGDKGAVQSGETIQYSYDETVSALQSGEIRVFAFADNDMTGGPGNNQDVSMGFFTPYQGKTPIPTATDGGAFNINEVLSGQISLSDAINESVEMSLCAQYIPQ